jgi:hypothetical protein
VFVFQLCACAHGGLALVEDLVEVESHSYMDVVRSGSVMTDGPK